MILTVKKFYFIFVLLFVSNSLAAEIPIKSQRTLKQQVDLYVEMLGKEITKVKTQKEKVAALNRVLAHVQELKQASAEASEKDRLYANYLVAGLKVVPSPKNFKVKNCDSYQSKVAEIAQTSEDLQIAKEALAPTESFLQNICPQKTL